MLCTMETEPPAGTLCHIPAFQPRTDTSIGESGPGTDVI